MRILDPRLARRTRAIHTVLAADVAIGLLTALLVLGQAVLLATIVSRAFDGGSLGDVTTPLVLLVAVVAARATGTWAFEVVGRRGASRVLSQLRHDLVERRLSDRPAALDGARGAEVATVAVAGIDALETMLARYLPQVVLAAVVPVAVLVVVAWVDLIAAAVMVGTLPLVPVFMWLIGRSAERHARERLQALTLLGTHFLDVVRGLPTLRAFNRGRAQVERVAEVSDDYRRATMGTLRVALLSGAVLELAATLGIALVAVTVGVRLVNGGIGFAAALTVLLLAPELYLPLRNLGAQFHASADGRAVTNRLLDLLEGPDPPSAMGRDRAPSPADASIRFENVGFAYPGRPGDVLVGLDLELAPGEMVALTGPSGAGKSTVAALLLLLAVPDRGKIVVGGRNLAGCDVPGWRRHVAWVPQHPTLFRGTIADNIQLGSRSASAEELRAAAALAGADGFVSRLPQGYETIVGDGGRPLSSGERRRIALARAFVRDAPLVVLDEPTADLDRDSAEMVAEAVERLRHGRTLLLIAHRPELALRADRVVRLEGGRVRELPAEVLP